MATVKFVEKTISVRCVVYRSDEGATIECFGFGEEGKHGPNGVKAILNLSVDSSGQMKPGEIGLYLEAPSEVPPHN